MSHTLHRRGFSWNGLTVYVRVAGDKIEDISFQGTGCAISTASASIMTEALHGKTAGEAEALFQKFHKLVAAEGDDEGIGKLAVFKGVSAFPMRVKCATLAWHTLRAALKREEKPVTTE